MRIPLPVYRIEWLPRPTVMQLDRFTAVLVLLPGGAHSWTQQA